MISLYGLFILLLTAGAIHAQGNTNDDDGTNQPSGSKDVPKKDTGLPQRVHPLRLKRPLQGSSTHDESGASSSTEPQPKKVCKGGHGIQQISSPCSQQPSPSGSQPSTSYDPPQSDGMPLPALVGESEATSYKNTWGTDEYREFTEKEAQYFKSKYHIGKELGKGYFGLAFLATRRSDGKKVAYKSIPKSNVYKYALESTPPSRCHLPNPLVHSKEPSVEQCMSPRPPNLLVPHEFMTQMYLSRPGYENPYVPVVFDYFILEYEYLVVMEYFDEQWVNLASYAKEKGRLDIENARDIVKEIVNGMISLKQHGILHNDLYAANVLYNPKTREVKLIDFGLTKVLPGWEEGISLPLKPSDPPSPTVSEYKAGADELWRIWVLGKQLLSTSIAHLVVECEQVTGHRIQSGLVPAIQKSRLRLLGRALDPGVENVYTWLRGGVLNGEANLDQCWLDGTVEHESMGTRHDNRALAARLADFLQVAYRQYQSTLWKYHRDRLVEVG
ncbi:hypothetical protein BASA61_008628 [Batrachochytrium salamandrivorans]|nr:hypothetical protein BASA61_008628 [Batrachochytrium salamandrivorans]